MNIFPIKRIKIRTDLSREDVQRRIASTSEYKGTSTLDGFSIQRVIFYRNSFRPLIIGHILDDRSNTLCIDIKMGIHKGILIFIPIFLLLFIMINLMNPLDYKASIPLFPNIEPWLITVIMIPIIIITAIISYYLEVKRSTKDLLRILDAVAVI